MPVLPEALAASIEAAFKKSENSLGPTIVGSTTTQGTPGSSPVVVPVTEDTLVDPKLAKAIAGAVADGIAKFLP